MAQELSLFDSPSKLPAHLQGFSSSLSTDLALGGMGRNRIGLKGSRFRLIVSGTEEAVLEQTSLEVVIVGAAKGAARIYYGTDYDPDEKTHPLCYSVDGIAPANDIANPQSTKCAVCPQNQKGSKITKDGTKTKACGYFKRLAVTLINDPQHRVFQLDGKALTIFGVGQAARNLFTLNEYAKKLDTRGYDAAHLVTKLSFDTDSSVPKLYFSPVRLLKEDEAAWVQELVNSDEVKNAVEITAITDDSDTASEAPSAEQKQPPKAAPAPAPKAVPVTRAATPKPTVVKVKPGAIEGAAVAAAEPPPKVMETKTGDDSLDEFLKDLSEG